MLSNPHAQVMLIAANGPTSMLKMPMLSLCEGAATMTHAKEDDDDKAVEQSSVCACCVCTCIVFVCAWDKSQHLSKGRGRT